MSLEMLPKRISKRLIANSRSSIIQTGIRLQRLKRNSKNSLKPTPSSQIKKNELSMTNLAMKEYGADTPGMTSFEAPILSPSFGILVLALGGSAPSSTCSFEEEVVNDVDPVKALTYVTT
jgi:hypothetical protein